MDIEKFGNVLARLEVGEAADYQAGVLRLRQHCRNRNLVAQLLKNWLPANREKPGYERLKLFTTGDGAQVSELQTHLARAVQGTVPSPAVPTQPATPDVLARAGVGPAKVKNGPGRRSRQPPRGTLGKGATAIGARQAGQRGEGCTGWRLLAVG